MNPVKKKHEKQTADKRHKSSIFLFTVDDDMFEILIPVS